MFSSSGQKKAGQSTARRLVREVHITILQLAGYIGVFVILALAVLELVSGPRFERAAEKLLSSSVLATRADWSAGAAPPVLRGRQLP